jgi:hypothetical protein
MHRRFDLYLAAMPDDDRMNNGQTQSGATLAWLFMRRTLEGREQIIA